MAGFALSSGVPTPSPTTMSRRAPRAAFLFAAIVLIGCAEYGTAPSAPLATSPRFTATTSTGCVRDIAWYRSGGSTLVAAQGYFFGTSYTWTRILSGTQTGPYYVLARPYIAARLSAEGSPSATLPHDVQAALDGATSFFTGRALGSSAGIQTSVLTSWTNTLTAFIQGSGGWPVCVSEVPVSACAHSPAWYKTGAGATAVTAAGYFFATSYTWTRILSGTQTGAYYVLARAYIPARLSAPSGTAGVPAEVAAALSGAETFFTGRALGSSAGIQTSTLTSWSSTLSSFSAGGFAAAGWPVCDESGDPPPPPAGWSDPVSLTTSGVVYESIAASGRDVHFAMGDGALYYRRSMDEGVTLGPWRYLGAGTLYLERPVAAAGSRVAIATVSLTQSFTDFFGPRRGGDILFTASSDTGSTFTPQRQITQGAYALRLSMAISGNSVHLVWMDYRRGVWDLYYMRSLDMGATWSFPFALVLGTNVVGAERPVLSVSGSYVHISWMDARDNRPPCYIEGGALVPYCTEVYYKRSADLGATWGPDVRITNSSVYAGRPDMAASGSSVVVSYDLGDPSGNEVGVVASSNSGSSFGPMQRLVFAPGVSTHSNVSVRPGTGEFMVSWNDNRSGTAVNYARTSLAGGVPGSWAPEEVISPAGGIPMVANTLGFQHLLYGSPGYGPPQYRRRAY